MKTARYIFCIVAAVISLPSGFTFASEWQGRAEAEGKITWYASLGATDARRIIDRFKELYPKIDAHIRDWGQA